MTLAARLLVALALFAGLLLVLAWRKRRARTAFVPRLARLPAGSVALPGVPLTALYFTSRFCGACKETPEVVLAAAPEVPALALPLERHAALARDVGVRETPTLLLVDAEGRIRYAVEGNPEPAELWTYVREAWDSVVEAQDARTHP